MDAKNTWIAANMGTQSFPFKWLGSTIQPPRPNGSTVEKS